MGRQLPMAPIKLLPQKLLLTHSPSQVSPLPPPITSKFLLLTLVQTLESQQIKPLRLLLSLPFMQPAALPLKLTLLRLPLFLLQRSVVLEQTHLLFLFFQRHHEHQLLGLVVDSTPEEIVISVPLREQQLQS